MKKKKINVKTYDPWVNKKDLDKKLKTNHIENLKNILGFDGVIIAVGHDIFKKIGIKKIKSFCKKKSVIFDIKNLFKSKYVDGTL